MLQLTAARSLKAAQPASSRSSHANPQQQYSRASPLQLETQPSPRPSPFSIASTRSRVHANPKSVRSPAHSPFASHASRSPSELSSRSRAAHRLLVRRRSRLSTPPVCPRRTSSAEDRSIPGSVDDADPKSALPLNEEVYRHQAPLKGLPTLAAADPVATASDS